MTPPPAGHVIANPDGAAWKPAFQRFAVETLVLMVVVIACFKLLIVPHLQSHYPAVFPQEMARTTGKELPQTRLWWAQLGALLVFSGPFIYYRLFHTDLGRTLTALFEPETADR